MRAFLRGIISIACAGSGMQWSAASSDLAATFPLSSLRPTDLSRSVQLILESAQKGLQDQNRKLINEIEAADKELRALLADNEARQEELEKLKSEREKLSDQRYTSDIFEFMVKEWQKKKEKAEGGINETSRRKDDLCKQLCCEKEKEKLIAKIADLEPKITDQEAKIDALYRQCEELRKACSQEDQIREEARLEASRVQGEIEAQYRQWKREQDGYRQVEAEYTDICAQIEQTERQIGDTIAKCRDASIDKIAIRAQSEHKQREFSKKQRLSEQVYGDYRVAQQKMLELGIGVYKQDADCCIIEIKEIERFIAQFGDLSLAEFLQRIAQ